MTIANAQILQWREPVPQRPKLSQRPKLVGVISPTGEFVARPLDVLSWEFYSQIGEKVDVSGFGYTIATYPAWLGWLGFLSLVSGIIGVHAFAYAIFVSNAVILLGACICLLAALISYSIALKKVEEIRIGGKQKSPF